MATQTAGGLELTDTGNFPKKTSKEKRLAKKRRVQADREELRASASGHGKGKQDGKGDGSKGVLKAKDQAGDDLCFGWMPAGVLVQLALRVKLAVER